MGNLLNSKKNELSFENVILMALKTPGVKINRSKFLRKELRKYCSKEIIDEAIKSNPAKAGISKKCVNKISKAVIEYETKKVTVISFTASLPSGAWAFGAATADIVSYFAHIIRVVQELAYLYGFEEFQLNEDEIDSETLNQLIIFVGAMFGVESASTILKKFADNYAKFLSNKIANKALTKTFYYPIVKKIAMSVGIHMNKQIFADAVASAIPIVGAFASGGLTYAMFKPNCEKLRKMLSKYDLCDPNYYKVIDVKTYEEIED